MNIKQGYKQTEIGIIPEDWEVEKFSDVTDVITCGLAATPTYVSEQNGKPFLSAQNVNSGKVILNKYKFITNDLFYQITKHNFPEKGDLLYTRVGAGIGEAGVIETDLKFGIYVSLTLIKTNKKVLDNYFLLHILNSPNYKFLAKNGQLAGGGVQNLNVQTVKEFPIILPPLPEQTAIATALSDIDALIGELDKLIAKKQGIKQATMQQLLTGKKRLAGFTGEWEVKRFKDVCWFQEGPGLRNWQFTKSGIKVINVTNLENGVLNLERTDRHISLNEFRKMYEHFEIQENDIVVASSGNSYGKIAVVRNQDLPLLMNTSVIRFKPLKNLDYGYLLTFLNSEHFKNQIDLMITGGAQPNFGPFHLNKLLMEIPPSIEEQTAIANILSDMNTEISQLEGRRAKMGELKQGMMQELLTGRIRLTGVSY